MHSQRLNRRTDELREVQIDPHFIAYPEGSILIHFGQTRVLCNATIEAKLPPWLRDQGKGWVTAEYNMLPRSTHTRSARERSKIGGRTAEIQRLIGRSLRAVTNLEALGERSIIVDCDVLQADGGTRTAAITGSYLALYLALNQLVQKGDLSEIPLVDSVAAISVGIIANEIYLDLDYSEDSQADVDMNFVMTGQGKIVEIQGTAETYPFTRHDLNKMYDLAEKGIAELTQKQNQILQSVLPGYLS